MRLSWKSDEGIPVLILRTWFNLEIVRLHQDAHGYWSVNRRLSPLACLFDYSRHNSVANAKRYVNRTLKDFSDTILADLVNKPVGGNLNGTTK
jgi:hypothetical protein